MAYHRIQIAQHLYRWHAAHTHTLRRQPRIARRITLRPVAAIVRLAVDLDCQPMTSAEEVEDISAGRMLAAEPQPVGSLAKRLP